MIGGPVRAGRRLGLRRHLQPQVVAGDAVYLLSERGVTALRGQHVETIVPLLDGSRDRAALLWGTHGVPPETVAGVLDRLDAADLLAEHDGPDEDGPAYLGRAALPYWDAAGLDALTAAARTATARISVQVVGGIGPLPVVAALARAGLAVHPHGGEVDAPPPDLAVVLCADYTDPALAAVAAGLCATDTPWLIARPVGEQVLVGPFFVPGQGACWTCLATRLLANRPLGNGRAGPRGVVMAPVGDLAAGVVALEAVKWIAGHRGPGQHRLWVFDSLTMEVATHPVAARPQCPDCGDPLIVSRRAFQPVTITATPKARGHDGGHRAVAPAEMLARYEHLVSPLTGVVREIRRDPRGPHFLQCFRSGPNRAALAAEGLDGLRSALRSDTAGKGTTAEGARVGALCEAVERYSGTFHGDEAVQIGSYAELAKRAVHPDTCRLQDPAQLVGRAASNADHSSFQRVLDPFDTRLELPWTPVWSLTARTHRLIPTGMAYFGGPGPDSVAADSNGCAAGSSVADAILQGLFEVVERDAVALWWYNRTAQPAVDLDSARDRWIDDMREVYADLGREFWVLDVTADLGIPVMAAISRCTSGPEDVVFGFGAHLDPAVALRRALTELNQIVPGLIGLTVERVQGLGDLDLARWLTRATVENQRYLLPDPGAAPVPLGAYPAVRHDDLAADVADVTGRIEAAGLEVLVLDQTRPDVGMPVVRVTVPGMRHFWSRFAPGRLFDVPVRLGRLAGPTPYEELNPMPMFL